MRTNRFVTLLFAAVLLTVTLGPILFSSQAIVSGDASLWNLHYLAGIFPQYMAGYWDNLFFTGYPVPASLLTPQRLLLPLLQPELFIKWLLFSSVLLTAACTWLWMRAQGRTPLTAACVAIGLALSGHYFTMISAGHLGKLIMFPLIIGALACIETAFRKKSLIAFGWCGVLLALAMGEQPDVTIMTGTVPVLLILFKTFRENHGTPLSRRLRFTLIGGCIATILLLFTAAPVLKSQFGTHIQNVSSLQTSETVTQKWDWATQWSLPPEDTIELFCPAPFGIKSNDEKLPYWGRQGRTPGWESTRTGFRNFRQEEQYCGVILIFFAVLAAAGVRKTDKNRTEILFWLICAGVFYLLALGRYAFLYRIFYELPFAGSMRNPVKFMFALQLCLAALAGYGIDRVLSLNPGRFCPARSAGICSGILLAAAAVLFAARHTVSQKLTAAGWDAFSPALAANLSFSVFYSGLMLALLTGWLAGYNRLRKAGFLALLPALMSLDTGYIVTRHVDLYDAKAVYRSNSLIEFLKQQSPAPRIKILSNQSLLRYWCNTVFPDSGVQQIDVMAESRLPSDKAFFLQSLGNNPLRYWQLTSTQFVLADHAVWMSLKSHPELAGAMTPAYPFTAQQKQDGSVETLPFPVTETAPFLLLRLNDALPRAALYTRWEILPDIPATGQRLAELSFNPKETVLLSNPAVPDSESGTDESSITPEITHYSPHRIDIRIPPQPSGTILLLNERYDPDWKVSIDGNSAQILRGNYLMRAVYVPPQRQTVSFTYEPNARLVHLSGITILLLTLASVTSGLLRFWRKAE